jgi:alkanesulfonate monooxygenase SsuD/methylene tetrahydromethanopterin reductase-like flavin-dependent oxidoreductase (luciferase family)
MDIRDPGRQYGLLLPHFGEFASRERLITGSQVAERYGFDSVWVRDHIVFHPHGMEGQDRTHVDPMVTLALIAGATENISLGTASLIPHRHPILTALLLSSLEFVAGPGRVIAGFGIGTFDHEFVSVGLGGIPRQDLLEEQVAIMRKLWSGEEVGFEGKYYEFRDVDIHPSPSSPGSIPIWYCGNSPASVRRAVEYCEGWMPGRITIKTFHKRMDRMRRLAGEANKPLPTAAAIPITSPAKTREAALSKVNWRGMLKSAVKTDWVLPESGAWESPDDLEGALIAGPPDHIITETRKYHDAGLQHLVYDLRFRFDDWEECLAILGEEVLPQLRREDAEGASDVSRLTEVR